MRNVTVRLREELIDRLDSEADERDQSRSEYIREILEDRHRADELQQELETLQDRLEQREERIDELEDQLARRSHIEEKVDELAIEVREEQQESNAPFFVRWWHWYRNRSS